MTRVYFNETCILLKKADMQMPEADVVFKKKSFPDFDSFLKKMKQETYATVVFDTERTAEQLFNEYFGLNLIVAGGGIVEAEGKYLAIFRRGKWDFPKGKKEKGETIEECAMREVKEEVGISTLMMREYFDTTYHIYKDKKQGWSLKKSVWFSMNGEIGEALTPQQEEDITDVGYFGLTELKAKFRANGYLSLSPILLRLSQN